MSSGIQPLSLRKNFQWTIAGHVLYSGCQWLLLLIFAKTLSPALVGQFSLALAVTAPLIAFFSFNLRAAQAGDVHASFAFSDYLLLRTASLGAFFSVLIAILSFAGYDPETSAVIVLVGCAKAFEAITDIFLGLFQHYERMDIASRLRFTKGVVSTAAAAAAVLISRNLLVPCLCLAAANGLLIFFNDYTAYKKFHAGHNGLPHPIKPPSLARLRALLRLCLPLGAVSALLCLRTNIPRYFLEDSAGPAELGVFSAIAYLTAVTNLVVQALGQSSLPRLAAYYAEQKTAAFNRLLLQLAAASLCFGLALLAAALTAGDLLLTVLYRPEYARAGIFIILAAANCFTCLFVQCGYALTAARCFRIQVPLTLLSVTAAFCFSLLWIPAYGLQGAAWAAAGTAVIDALSYGAAAVWAVLRLGRRQAPCVQKKALPGLVVE